MTSQERNMVFYYQSTFYEETKNNIVVNYKPIESTGVSPDIPPRPIQRKIPTRSFEPFQIVYVDFCAVLSFLKMDRSCIDFFIKHVLFYVLTV
ncbi:hypothetical protein Mpt1_c11340 [Candidatus Methanoplasma termitum]|uniref:Uncharacterized protein n=1 Tax=Candidatus Methanoplasma termitum TaxID=1577791 RepID=A0A0A7LHK5_9ARCH|nr:hypothetical protein Mpt1_c11340 [Candidatus Methanoplasma termitum]